MFYIHQYIGFSTKPTKRFECSKSTIQEFERKDRRNRHEASVHLPKDSAKCPQCGFTSSRYHTGNIGSYVIYREDHLPSHIDREHNGQFRALATISFCSCCGKINSNCNCKLERKKFNRIEMERRVQDQLGLNRPTRR